MSSVCPIFSILPKSYTNPHPGNILPDSTAAPAIQGQQRELEKHMRADSLNEKISNRPKAEDLIKGGVLQEDPTSPTSPDKLYEERIEDEYAKREGGA